MRYLKVAWLCLASVLAVSMALAGNASAALLWLLCLEGSGLTKYSSNQCTEASSTGKWQSLGLPSGGSDTVRLLAFSLRLTDKGTGVEIECPDAGTGWGLIESPNKGQVKVATIPVPKSECKVLKTVLTCETATLEEIKAVGLPWANEIFTTEGRSLTQIKGTTPAGWKIKCGGLEDVCEEEASKPEFAELLNGVTKGVLLVLARFEAKRLGVCKLGGKETGLVTGLVAILLWNGNGLSINNS